MAAAFTKDDFRRIQFSLAAAILMAAVGGAAVYAAMELHKAETKNRAVAQSKRSESHGRLARARDEEQEIKQKIARYNALSGRGIFGEERRLDWVERVRAIRSGRKLYDIQYEIAPQQALDPAVAPIASANYDFLSSTMQLRMKLLHEGDLLNFLADLREQAPAYIRARRCDVERLPKGAVAQSEAVPPQLGAECAIDWITIRERKGA
ncbi:MAG: hypothetical protein DPW12_14905 [Rhodocyclaceae bacterium]|nr:hypothetical protein [Zoogloeaceae bacterium]MCK6384737.1 hypothetical protein [Rhodocyclaceae bacterium]MCQ3925433.1 hypothetical protein [Rhodocyclaceae bacterium]